MKKIIGRRPVPPARKEIVENPVKLCHEVTRLSRAKVREVSIDGVMSQPGAHLVLSFLAVKDGITQREVVENTHLKAPTVSVILRKMEAEGIIERLQNPADKRETIVRLTDCGREIDARDIARIKQTDAAAVAGLSAEEYDTLMILLGKMKENLLRSLGEQRKEKRE